MMASAALVHSRLRLLLIAFLWVLSGCATTPTPPSAAVLVAADRLLAFQDTIESAATLVITRDRGFVAGGCYGSFSINGRLAARIAVGETATFHVAPGELLLRYGGDPLGRGLCGIGAREHWTQRETIARSGETKRFRLSLSSDGLPDIQRAD